MNETTLLNSCPKCGAALPSAATSGLCPRCLMAEAMLPTEKPGSDARLPAPSVESVAAAFPQLEILELIGQGGMGCVFKARQPKLNRLVALKLLPASLTERDAAFAGRFEREGQLLARLHHPNIVAVHDSGTAGEFFYLIMEYVDGVNLRQAMRARRFTPGQALAIVPHICDALQFAHDEGVLHRDIKPENILLDAKGRVKLADFGIAKLLGSNADNPVRELNPAQAEVPGLTQSGTALGTPSYMSPEQRDAPADVDHRADIYSLGVVFYELLTGELPQGSLAKPSEKSDADPRVDAIVQQALETERDRRQHSAGEVKTQVETIAGNVVLPPARQGPVSDGIAVPARFSRAAIWGAFWAPLFFVAFPMFYTRLSVSAGEYHGPALWQYALMFTLLPLAVASPFGTTILGWIAVSQIRRSAGKLYGLGLAVFDGLLFPLLLLDVVFASVLIRLLRIFVEFHSNFSNVNNPQVHPPFITRLANLLSQSHELVLFIAVLGAIVLDFLIIRRVWRAVKAPAEASGAAVPAASRSGCLWVIVILVVALLAVFAVMLSVWQALASPTNASGNFPKIAHIGGNHHSVEVVHDGAALHYVIYYPGDFSSSSSGSQNTHSLTWMDEGSIKLGNGRTFGYHRESTGPEHVRVNGTEYDLRQGRVFALHDDGSVEQLRIFPPLATASDPEELAKLVASARAMDVEPITVEKLRLQLEAAEAQLRDLLKGYAPVHPLVIEVRQSIETLKRKIPDHTEHGSAGKALLPIPPEAVAILDSIKALVDSAAKRKDDPGAMAAINAQCERKRRDLVVLLRGTEAQALTDRGEKLARELADTATPPDPVRRDAINKECKELEKRLWALTHPAGKRAAETVPATLPTREPRLQFRIVADASDAGSEVVDSRDGKQQFRLRREVLLDDAAVADAKVSGTGEATEIDVTFTEAGGKRFAEITGANTGKQIAIVFDGKVLSAPTIQSAITGGHAQITGKLTAEEAGTIATTLVSPYADRATKPIPQAAVLLMEAMRALPESYGSGLADPKTMEAFKKEAYAKSGELHNMLRGTEAQVFVERLAGPVRELSVQDIVADANRRKKLENEIAVLDEKIWALVHQAGSKNAHPADPVPGIELKVVQEQLEKTLAELMEAQAALAARRTEMKETHPAMIELQKKLNALEQKAENLRALIRQSAPKQ